MTTKINKQAYFESIGYAPHPKQWLFHGSSARFRAPVCGRRFGKSTMAARDLAPELFLRDAGMYWIVGPTYDLGEKEFRVLWNDLIIKKGLGKDKRVKKRYNKTQGEMWIEFPWGTRVEVRSAQHPETLVGEALRGVIVSEAAKHKLDTWERYIRPALSDYRGWATFPTTPEGQNWLYQIWKLGQNPKFPDFASWRFPSWDNIAVYPGGRNDPEIKLIEATTAPEWFLQEYGADFTSFVGRIYSEFDEFTHVLPEYTYNPAWPNYIAFDWGFTNPLAAVEFQVDPWDNIYVWREHYKSYMILEDHIAQLKQREQPPGYRIDCCFGDAADPEAVEYVNRHLAPCVADPDAKTNWRAGVDLVKTFLKLRDVGELDEYGTPKQLPRLYVHIDCVNGIREFNNYKGREGTPVRSPAELPQNIDDHFLDALRYGLVHLYQLGAANSHLRDVYETESGLTVISGGAESIDSTYFTMSQEL